MKLIITTYLIALTLFSWSCSELSEGSSAGHAGTPETGRTPNLENGGQLDGKNRTKKDGWQTPPRERREKVGSSGRTMKTPEGKQAEVVSTSFGFKTPWSYSEDFLDLRGPVQLESESFMEHSFHGRVFMYSIFAKTVGVPLLSNSDQTEERYVYLIQDFDGDGIFETLISGDAKEVLMPKWVLE